MQGKSLVIYWSRRLLARFKKPDFLIIGAQRAGTTSLFYYLMQAPMLRAPLLKEIHYFDLNYQKSPDWYFAHFPLNFGKFLTGEASPYYLYHPEVPARVAKLLPTIKLIVILRNPIDRAYSNYQHSVKLGLENRSFADSIQFELTGGRYSLADKEHREQSYLARGLYAEQLSRWQQFFPKEQFLLLISEQFFRQATASIFDFLKIPMFSSANNAVRLYNVSSYPQTLDEGLKAELSTFFHPHNQRLVDEFGLNIEDWS